MEDKIQLLKRILEKVVEIKAWSEIKSCLQNDKVQEENQRLDLVKAYIEGCLDGAETEKQIVSKSKGLHWKLVRKEAIKNGYNDYDTFLENQKFVFYFTIRQSHKEDLIRWTYTEKLNKKTSEEYFYIITDKTFKEFAEHLKGMCRISDDQYNKIKGFKHDVEM